jgi:excisionase family DNA binding protein
MALDKKRIREKYKDFEVFLENETARHRCACGCNEVIDLKESHFWNGIPKFIFGHAARLRIGGPSYNTESYYSVEDIAEVGQVSEQTVRLWARKNRITAHKTIGRKNLFLKEEINKFLSQRPAHTQFSPDAYISVLELKKMGVSRSKLRALVRSGKINQPRLYARKTHYLLEEIENYWSDIQEDRHRKQRRRVSVSAFTEMQNQIDSLEKRMGDLEKIITILAGNQSVS